MASLRCIIPRGLGILLLAEDDGYPGGIQAVGIYLSMARAARAAL